MATVYITDLDTNTRKAIKLLRTHAEMGKWLKAHGKPTEIYEIWKNGNIHSRWCWKEKTNKWGRMATISKNERENIK